MRKFFLVFMSLIAIFVLFIVSGCHTVQGFGEDLQSGGKAISKAAVQEEDRK